MLFSVMLATELFQVPIVQAGKIELVLLVK